MNRLDTDFSPVREFCTNLRALAEQLRDGGPVQPAAVEVPAGFDVVAQDDEAYVVFADLPGVAKEDLEVVIHGRICEVTYSRERCYPAADQLLVSERRFGTATRKLRFPRELDEQGATARLVQGVLELRLPKKQAARGQRVVIE